MFAWLCCFGFVLVLLVYVVGYLCDVCVFLMLRCCVWFGDYRCLVVVNLVCLIVF